VKLKFEAIYGEVTYINDKDGKPNGAPVTAALSTIFGKTVYSISDPTKLRPTQFTVTIDGASSTLTNPQPKKK
jgi:hypothetical protein